jgi:hypothetical protein
LLHSFVVPTLHAQESVYIPTTAKDSLRLYAFTDTNSVRVDLTVPRLPSSAERRARQDLSASPTKVLLWSGDIGSVAVDAQGNARLAGKDPRPQAEALVAAVRRRCIVWRSKPTATTHLKTFARIGFRSVSAKNGQILLNGKPIFLKGTRSIRRSATSRIRSRRIAVFVKSYVSYLKSVGVNIIAHSALAGVVRRLRRDGHDALPGQLRYAKGAKPTAAPSIPLAESIKWYKDDVLGPLVNHPSVVVFMLSNEQADKEIGYLSTGAEQVGKFLATAYDSLHAWDASRVYITNAGYGFGRSGDICDLHRYWGWYYNSFLSFYTMRFPVDVLAHTGCTADDDDGERRQLHRRRRPLQSRVEHQAARLAAQLDRPRAGQRAVGARIGVSGMDGRTGDRDLPSLS